jgi:hypothetical protein
VLLEEKSVGAQHESQRAARQALWCSQCAPSLGLESYRSSSAGTQQGHLQRILGVVHGAEYPVAVRQQQVPKRIGVDCEVLAG